MKGIWADWLISRFIRREVVMCAVKNLKILIAHWRLLGQINVGKKQSI